MAVLQCGSSLGCFKSLLEKTSLHTVLTIFTACSEDFSYRKEVSPHSLYFVESVVISYCFAPR